jgi:nucleoside-diphosphate-sugar epimerase
MTLPPQLHVVVGAGQVGRLLGLRLLTRGHRVRIIRRAPPFSETGSLEWACGDAGDPGFADQAFRGAHTVYHCANPASFRWEGLARLARTIRTSAARAGARLVVLDNLFMYGRPREGLLSEDHPHRPCSRKGELRARLAGELFEAHARGEVRATAGYAGDFFGATATDQSAVFGTRFFAALRRRRRALVLGDPDQPHAYGYLPDVAEGLAILGTSDAALGRPWHLATSWNGSTRALMERFAAALGQPPRLLPVPRAALRLAGLFNRTLREAAELTYQWEGPYCLDDRRFRATFAMEPTPIEVAVAETLRGVGLLAAAR